MRADIDPEVCAKRSALPTRPPINTRPVAELQLHTVNGTTETIEPACRKIARVIRDMRLGANLKHGQLVGVPPAVAGNQVAHRQVIEEHR
ncbi:MAG: hypothetical protein ACYDB1_09695 [Acidiferrobacteraceae bacterium]